MVLNIKNLIFYLLSLLDVYAGLTASNSIPNQKCQNALFPEPPCCGVISNKVTENKFPWIVSINGVKPCRPSKNIRQSYGKTLSFCSGSLINSRWVLTTAECVFNRLGNAWKWQVFIKPACSAHMAGAAGVQKFMITKTIYHESYNSLTEENSIALLLLNKHVIYSAFLKPICLPFNRPANNLADQLVIVAIWNLVIDNKMNRSSLSKALIYLPSEKPMQEFTPQFGIVPEINWDGNALSTAVVHILDLKICKEYEWDYEPEMCAYKTDPYDYCYANAGGPLMLPWRNYFENSKTYYLIGLTHISGTYCFDPDAYVNISNYLQWIQDTVLMYSVRQK